MLLNFRVKNYKSFVEDSELNMLAASIKEHSDSLIVENDVKVLPIAAIFGANGSGKSNFLEAIALLHDLLIVYSSKDERVTLKDCVSSYIFDSEIKNSPTELEISVCDKEAKKEYRYGISLNSEKILEEWLFMKVFSQTKNVKEKCVFYREYGKKLRSDLSDKDRKEIDFVFSFTLEDELLMSNLGKRGISKYQFIYRWFKEKANYLNYSNDIFLSKNNLKLMEVFYKNKNWLDFVVKFMKTIDESIINIEIDEETNNNLNVVYTPYSIHKNDDGSFARIPFSLESSGSKKMLTFLLYLLVSLNNGFTLVVDELDAKLHPLILRYIVGLYSNKEINIGGGQLIFTSHNLICLDSSDLRRDEIFFVEKINQKSSLFSLYDFKESSIRNDLSFGKHYLNGRFGAVPFINDDKE
ncbi:MAG: ATP-binding protein [Bacilli bacterium]|nr:ATP-binding protein [Bacillales bacterium]MDY2575412.1 ATP-binding protein [Bacilli bacterium]